MSFTNRISFGYGPVAKPDVRAVNEKEAYQLNCEGAPHVQGWINGLERKEGYHVCGQLVVGRENVRKKGGGKGGGKQSGGPVIE